MNMHIFYEYIWKSVYCVRQKAKVCMRAMSSLCPIASSSPAVHTSRHRMKVKFLRNYK